MHTSSKLCHVQYSVPLSSYVQYFCINVPKTFGDTRYILWPRLEDVLVQYSFAHLRPLRWQSHLSNDVEKECCLLSWVGCPVFIQPPAVLFEWNQMVIRFSVGNHSTDGDAKKCEAMIENPKRRIIALEKIFKQNL